MEQNEHQDQGGEKNMTHPAEGAMTHRMHKKDHFLPISILVAAVVIAGAVIFATLYKPNTAAAPAAGGNNDPSGAQQANGVLPPIGSRDAILGNANAPVTIVEYGDYQCPYCAEYFSQIQPQIVSTYVNTGKARMVFRDFPFLGPESTAAANAAQCAEDQNKLWAYHDALYAGKLADDMKGGGENDGFYNRTLFLKLASQVGLDIPTFTTCIDTNKNAALVTQESTNANAAGVNSTPVTFVNGTEVKINGQSAGASPTAVLQAIAAAGAAK